jgi:hypothetical protein
LHGTKNSLLYPSHLSLTFALFAGFETAARLGTTPAAGRTGVQFVQSYFFFNTKDCFTEGQLHIDLNITTSLRPPLSASGGTKHAAEKVAEVHAALAKVLPATIAPDIRLVWEPPWNPSMMNEATKQHFGWTPE